MNRNLFDSLFSYRPRPDRKPLEDYFTQLIAFLFSLDAKLASEWIKAIWKESLTNPEDIRILTQYSLGDYGRADIALFWSENRTDKSVLIEHKIGSSVGWRGLNEEGVERTQVDNYLSYQKERGDPKNHKVAICKVSAISEYQNSSPYFLGEFTWDQLYKILNKLVRTEHTSGGSRVKFFLFEQTSEFMRRHNMVFENFNIQDLASLDLQTKFLKKWNRLNEIVIAAFKDSSKDIEKILGFSTPVWGTANVGSHWGLIIHNKKKPDGSTIWVHIGLSTMSEQSVWFPVVTMGSQRIPDVQVALALWPESLEKAKRIYGDVSVKLNATLGDIAGSSIGFEAIEDNKYIFFSLREPLNEFLKYEDQESKIIEFLGKGFQVLVNFAKGGFLSKMANDINFK